MDTLTCRSPSRCATCAHFSVSEGCALENELDIVLAALEKPRAPVRAPPALLLVDARRAPA